MLASERIISDSGREKPSVDDLVTPEVGNNLLINYAVSTEALQGNWTPPASLMVYQIAGTGIDTPAGVTYFTDQKCVSRSAMQLFRCTAYASKLGYRINGVIDGDGTVVVPSALSMGRNTPQVESIWLDLETYNSDGILGSQNLNRKHKDLFEVDEIVDFVANTIEATTSNPYDYLVLEQPTLRNGERLVFQLHSPLDMLVKDGQGREISSSTVSIEGGKYERYGELQYISLPDTGGTKSLHLKGLAEGSFTLDAESFNEDGLEKRHTYQGIPSGTSTRAELTFTNSTSIDAAVLAVDYEDNGTIDISYDEKGPIPEAVTYQTLIAAIEALKIKTLQKTALLVTAKLAENYHKQSVKKPAFKTLEKLTLLALQQEVLLLHRKGVISNNDRDTIIKIIQELSKI